ncbi:hypothetical protein AMTRI_Chr10g1580 [Amborella trichopoda]
MLADCQKLKELPDSLGSLAKLKDLDVGRCRELSRFPASMRRMRSLRYLRMASVAILDMSWCKRLKELPKNFGSLISSRILKIRKINLILSFFSGFSSLEELDATYCNLEGLNPDDFEKLSSLKKLSLFEIDFQGLPISLRGLSQLEMLILPTSLKALDASGCESLQTILKLSHLSKFVPKILNLSRLSKLERLHVSNCEKLSCVSLEVIPNLSLVSKLERLDVSNCEKLSAIHDLPTNLKILNASKCISLEVVPNLSHLSKLEKLDASNCRSLETISKLSHLSKLQHLDVSDCQKLLAIEDLPTTLKILKASNCIRLVIISNLSHHSQLEEFDSRNCKRMTKIQGVGGSKSLRKLRSSGCSPHVWRGQNLAKIGKCFNKCRAHCLGLYMQAVMVCLVIYVHHSSYTRNRHVVDLWIKREGEILPDILLQSYPVTNQNEIYFYHFREGQYYANGKFWLEDGDEIEVKYDPTQCEDQAEDIDEPTECEDQVEDIDELRASSLRFPCIRLKKVGIHFIYESEDTEDSTEEKLANSFNSL